MAMDAEYLRDLRHEEEGGEEEEEDNSDLDEEEKRVAEEKAYRRMLREVRAQVGEERPNLTTDKGEKECLACPTYQSFKGWKALLSHAASFKKRRPQQHRGYHRALAEILQPHNPTHDDQGDGGQRTTPLAPSLLIVWPPIVIAEAFPAYSDTANKARVGLALSDAMQDLHVERTVEVPPTAGWSSRLRWVLVFEASVMGYLEASRLPDILKKQRCGMLRGYLAEPRHMQVVDPKKRLVSWSLEDHQEKVKGAQKKSKQEHDKEQAKLKEIELEVENLTEDERKFKINKEHMECLIQQRQKEIEGHEKRGKDMEQRFQEAMRNMDQRFQVEMKKFDALSHAKVKRLREDLENSERRLEEGRSVRMKEVEMLEKQFLALTEDHKKQEAQKALQREREAMQKRKIFKLEMEKAEADFNKHARQQESELQEQQEREMMALMEDAKREREELLTDWLQEQNALKQKCMDTKQMNEQQKNNSAEQQSTECAVCWETLNTSNRALLKPCGHAKCCMDCAKDIYQSTKLCPICRQKIEAPTLFPKRVFY